MIKEKHEKYIIPVAFLIASNKMNGVVSTTYSGNSYKIGTDYEILEIADNENNKNIMINATFKLVNLWNKDNGFEKINGIPVLSNAQLNYLEKKPVNKIYSNEEKIALTRKYIEFYLGKSIENDEEIAEYIAQFVDDQQTVILDTLFNLLHIIQSERMTHEEK